MDDITTMWVWIPRYKYQIFNGNNNRAKEQMINVDFEYAKESTGTVKCNEQISQVASQASSETCSDTTNNGIVNGKSTYTHPAFTFGDEELTGFWMAKFEMSTDNTSCNTTANTTNCNKTGFNIIVKPNQKSLRYISVSNSFANIRKMETYANIHGFSNSESASTWLDSSGNLTGEIANDDNKLDIHMIKNMEWGAVAYLSQSKYGKYGNSLYVDNYKEIYINNNSNIKTGYSGGSYDSESSSSETFLYNNLNSNGTGQGYKGAGASTTGTVYGVFDLSGGVAEYTMGGLVNLNGTFYASSAGTWTTTVYPQNKYHDKYFYNIDTRPSPMSPGDHGEKLGDATKEVTKVTGSGKWFNDNYYYPNYSDSWFLRGGTYTETTYAGLFSIAQYSSGVAADSSGSRPVLAISRDMPWLNN